MEQFLNNQQIPLVQVIDPNTGQQYYVPAATAYNDRNGPNPTILKSVTVDQAVSASYFSGSISNAIYAATASYLDRPVVSASYAETASYISPLFISSSAAAAGFGSGGNFVDTSSFATTGSNIFNGNQTISGSVILTGSLTISGSSTFTNIGPAIFNGSITNTSGFTGSYITTNDTNLVLSTTNRINNNTGTITINSGSNAEIRISANGSGLVSTSNGARAGIFRRTEVSQSAGTNYNINWDTNGWTIPQFTYSSGVFTNTSSRTRTFVFSMQVAIQAVSTGFGECDIWFSYNDTFNSENRYGQVAYFGSASSNQILSTTWNFILAQNQTVRCYIWADQAYRIGHGAFGNATNYSCKLQVAEII